MPCGDSSRTARVRGGGLGGSRHWRCRGAGVGGRRGGGPAARPPGQPRRFALSRGRGRTDVRAGRLQRLLRSSERGRTRRGEDAGTLHALDARLRGERRQLHARLAWPPFDGDHAREAGRVRRGRGEDAPPRRPPGSRGAGTTSISTARASGDSSRSSRRRSPGSIRRRSIFVRSASRTTASASGACAARRRR